MTNAPQNVHPKTYHGIVATLLILIVIVGGFFIIDAQRINPFTGQINPRAYGGLCGQIVATCHNLVAISCQTEVDGPLYCVEKNTGAVIGECGTWLQADKYISSDRCPPKQWTCAGQTSATASPTINPTDFATTIDHTYFRLKPGTKFTYQKKTAEGLERIEVVVTNERKTVMGVPTTVVWDRVWLNDTLIEDTRDWYAQDKAGDVWYMGEQVDNYQDGKIVDHEGSWEAGVDGALPGIIMKAVPKVGDSYRQEYYRGQAEDMGDVIAVNKEVTVPLGTFKNCLQTRDWSKIDNALNEYKYYCPEVGFVVMEEEVAEPEEKTVLVGFTKT